MKLPTLAIACTLTACQMNAVERDVEHREVGLFVPSAIRAVEPPAERVTILHPDGRMTVMEQALLRRDGERFRLESRDGKRAAIDLTMAEIQAIEIERWTRGEGVGLPGAGRRDDGGTDHSFMSFSGGLLIGVGLITTIFLAVDVMKTD